MNYYSETSDISLPNNYFYTARSQRSVLQSDDYLDDDTRRSGQNSATAPDDSELSQGHFLAGSSSASLQLAPIQYEPGYTDPSIWNMGLSVPPMISVPQSYPTIYSDSVAMSSNQQTGNCQADSPPQSPISNIGATASHRPRRPKSGAPCRRLSFPSLGPRRFSGAGMASATLNQYKDCVPKLRSVGAESYEDFGLPTDRASQIAHWENVATAPRQTPSASSTDGLVKSMKRRESRPKELDIETLISANKAPIATAASDVPLTGGLVCSLGSDRIVAPMVSTDPNGIIWMDFEHRVKKELFRYRVRISDLDADVPLSAITPEFKVQNCIYPHAMVPRSEYVGHRQKYEMTCNDLGWRLAYLNPEIRGQRGLIQRAIDSYRNSSSDVSLRSRRARKLYREKGSD